jgi:hypothetical protein
MAADVGYLSNKRMALEIGIGLAELSGRMLSLPVDDPIGWGPRPALEGAAAGPPSTLRDLYDLPVTVLGDDEYQRLAAGRDVRTVAWPDLHDAVYSDQPRAEDFAEFALGRPVVSFDRSWDDEPILVVAARGLSLYSYFFHLRAGRRRSLFRLLECVRPKDPYRELAAELASVLGPFSAAHIRRTDHLAGVPDARSVTPWMIRDNLAEVFPRDQRMVVCTEADPTSGTFALLLDSFDDVVFLSDLVLSDPVWRSRFTALDRHDDSALAVVTQEVAARAERFVGTFGSTFTAMIHRQRQLADPGEPFWFTGDFLGGDTRFERCQYLPVAEGPFTWNRHRYPVPPGSLSWMREWPEVVVTEG